MAAIAVVALTLAAIATLPIRSILKWRHARLTLSGSTVCALPRSYAQLQARCFGRLGRTIARRPWLTLFLSSGLSLAAATGLFAVKVHGDALTMWLPSDAPSKTWGDDYTYLTGRPRPRALLVLLEASDSNGASLRPALDFGLTIHERIVSAGLNTSAAASGLSAAGEGVFSPLLLWRYSRDVLTADTDPAATIRTALSDSGLDNGFTAGLLGSMIRLSENGRLQAMMLTYTLDGHPDARDATIAFERRVRTILKDEVDDIHDELSYLQIHILSESALSDDLDVAVSSDTSMIMLSMILMTLYVACTLGRHRDALRCRGSLASAAVLSICLATFAAFGIAALCGVEYNDNVNMAIFVLLGVGIDDAFVIIRALEDVPQSTTRTAGATKPAYCCDKEAHEEVADRIGTALENCGSAILLSSMTNAIAFALGARSPLPALHGFCAYAAIGMVCDFLLQLTFFVAAATIDEQRQQCGRAIFPCILAERFPIRALRPHL